MHLMNSALAGPATTAAAKSAARIKNSINGSTAHNNQEVNMAHEIFDGLAHMAHSKLTNYIVPGLASSLIGGNGHGCVRLFESSRSHQENITPHSHRFDFQCLVLCGKVTNDIWRSVDTDDADGDAFTATELIYEGKPGEYARKVVWSDRFNASRSTYFQGEWYSMKSNEIHSIYFDRNTKVLFFEGPEVTNKTLILEPCVDGVRIPTFDVKQWMFGTEKHGEN